MLNRLLIPCLLTALCLCAFPVGCVKKPTITIRRPPAAVALPPSSTPVTQPQMNPPIATAAVSSVAGDYRLRAKDEVDLQIYGEPGLSGKLVIDEQGEVRHGVFGRLKLSGLTVAEAESAFLKLADRFLIRPSLILTLVSIPKAQVVVMGEVKSPGVYPLPIGDGLTLLQAIAAAGGFTSLASPDRVRVVRTVDGKQESIRVKVSELLSGSSGTKDMPLQADDIITVPQVIF